MMSDDADFLSVAQQAAQAAGHLLAKRKEGRLKIELSQGRDVKTREDRDAEAAILHFLRSRTAFPVLSEEAGGSFDPGSSQPTWIVDPLDGTVNLSRGIPLCSVSVALWRGMQPILGVVYDFMREEMFTGQVGQGASCNNQPIRVSSTQEKSQGIMCTGFPVCGFFEEESLNEFIGKVQAWKKVRLLGSAALSLAWVACGRADAYAEDGIRFWDVAAGLALVLAAGGSFDMTVPDASHRLSVIAGNGLQKPTPPR